MRDLLCFRLLVERQWDHPELPELLKELSRRTATQRVSFFGALLELVWSDAPAAQALLPLALECLGDADGHLAIEAVVAGLGDEATRAPALRALRKVAGRQPARWVHALFHGTEAVRDAAVDEAPPTAARHLELYALADPALRARVLARTEPLTCTTEDVGAVFRFLGQGVIDAEHARVLLADPKTILPWVIASRARSASAVAWMERPSTFDPEALASQRDDLDVVLDLFWEATPERILTALAEDDDLAHRRVLSLLAVAARRGSFSKPMLVLLFALAPAMIAWNFLPERVRLDAVLATNERGAPLAWQALETVHPLLFHPLCVHPDGGADLRVLAALLSVATTGNAVQQLVQWVGQAPLLEAMEARPADAATVFALADKDDLQKRELYVKLGGSASEGMLHAFVREAPEASLGFLAHADGVFLVAALLDIVNKELPSSRARRLAELTVKRLDGHLVNELFARWNPRPTSEEAERVQLGFALLFAAARELSVERFIGAVTHSARTLPVILQVIDDNPTFPYGKEVALAHAVRTSPDPFVRRWVEARVRAPEPPPLSAVRASDDALSRAIITGKRTELPALVAPFLEGGRNGLAYALARRTDNPAPHATVCAALLASCDPPSAVDAALVRWGADEAAFTREIEAVLIHRKHQDRPLSLLGHAVLWRWERHGRAFLEAALAAWGELPDVVRAVIALRSSFARRACMLGLADAIAVMGARDKPRFASLVRADLVDALVLALPSDLGPHAADALLSAWRYGPALLPSVASRIESVLVDADATTREKLAGWIEMVGVPSREPVIAPPPEADDVTLARVRASVDVVALSRWCRDPRLAVVHEATLRLIMLGEEGRGELARVLETVGGDAEMGPIAQSIPLWDDGPALARARRVALDPARPPPVRFGVALSMLERGERAMKHAVVEAVLEPGERTWFRPEHWTKLVERHKVDPTELAIDLAVAPQPHAYMAAVHHLLAQGEGDACMDALRAFLACGTQRMGALRRQVAEHLHARGDFFGFPIVLEHHLDDQSSRLLVGASRPLVRATTLSFLVAGSALAKESAMLAHLAPAGVDFVAKDEAYETILLHCASDAIRQRAALAVRSGMRHLTKLLRVAETFAWGSRIGQELLGKLYRVQMTGGKSLGHTFLKETRIHVTPLPILRDDRYGREIVEALILHELGHHMYHRGVDGRAAWAEAEKEGIHMLLNLVADEHLERNLRALDSSFGDRLKRLASYAFQHSERELAVRQLLSYLGGYAMGVLSKTPLRVARDPERVVVENGEVLFAMEREAMSFPRFMRALRMGLGNRHGDPIVEQALALFDADFRHKSMPELLAIARKLRDLFGFEVQMCNALGPHETLEGKESQASEEIIWGEGITQEEVDRMVERVLDPKHREGPPPREGEINRLVLNFSPKNEFDRITLIERVPYDPTAHRDYAQRVARPARVMRRYFEELGLHQVRQPMRLRGARLDRSRILPLVIRGEPRVLMQREIEAHTDLFLGIVIDCSGSMSSRDHMERARQFGMLLAEACAGLTGVDLRVFGFTDKVIYDCGDAARCSAYALRANGGNNDAAALFHAAGAAKASRRRAKLLVMISDGLPTECTVAALRELVQTLTRRWHMVCAQVAVQPLTEVCFPHYVVCNDPTIEQTVKRFGDIVMGLVRRTLGR